MNRGGRTGVAPITILALALCGCAFTGGCAYIGPPQAPTLDLPQRVTDLVAAQFGDEIEVQFTLAALTTEGLALKDVRSAELRAGLGNDPFSVNEWAENARRFDVPAVGPGSLGRNIPTDPSWIGKTIILGVRATGPKGKTSDWSNLVILNIKKPLDQPANVKADNVAQGVRLTWQGSSMHYRIFRSEADQKPQQLAESDTNSYLDTTTEYGKSYQYMVQATALELQQSKVSQPVEITPVDIFPPAVPGGLAIEAGVGAIELAWERNTEPDFKGYNVYRSVNGGPFEKIADSITAPAYSDHAVETGKKYRYAVSAVDLKGNESERCPPQEVTAE